MDTAAINILIQFYSTIDVFILIFFRIIAFLLIAPPFSGQDIPNGVKVALAVVVTYILFYAGGFESVFAYSNTADYVFIATKEVLVGCLLGFVVYFWFGVFHLVGYLIDYQIGFSMAMTFDPISQTQAPISGNLLYITMCCILVQSGGFHAILQALFYSFQTVPLGMGNIFTSAPVLLYIVKLMVQFFVLGITICLPVFGSVFIINIALGILVKAVPQMNVFSVGIPIKLIAGLIVFYLTMAIYSVAFDLIYNEAYRSLLEVIEGLAP